MLEELRPHSPDGCLWKRHRLWSLVLGKGPLSLFLGSGGPSSILQFLSDKLRSENLSILAATVHVRSMFTGFLDS